MKKKEWKRIQKAMLAVTLSSAMVFSNIGAGSVVAVTYAAEETQEINETEAKVQEPETKEPETKEPEKQEPETKEPETKEPEKQEPETKEPEIQEIETIQPEEQEEFVEEDQIAVFSNYSRAAAKNVSTEVGQTASLQSLKTLVSMCPHCGGDLTEDAAEDFRDVTANVANSSVAKYTNWRVGTKYYSGQNVPCMEILLEGVKPGETNVDVQYQANYYRSSATGSCDWCGGGVRVPSDYNWYTLSDQFKVTVNANYAINYVANGDKVTNLPSSTTTKVAKETANLTVSTGKPSREGFDFLGWAESATAKKAKYTGGESINLNWVQGNTVSKTLYAVWKNADEFTVTYTDGVPGEIVFPDQGYEVKYGEATPEFEGEPTRKGYTFMGWAPAVAAKVTEDVTYVATWQKNEKEFTLKYDANGGENAPETQTAKARADKYTFTISEQRPTREGFEFEGWSTSKDENATYQPGGSIDVTGTTTLYAVWNTTEVTYTVNWYESTVQKKTFFAKLRSLFFGAKNVEESEKILKTEQRKGITGDKVEITEDDKVCIEGYTFIEDHERNKLSDILKEDGTTTLALYMRKDEVEQPSTEEPSTEEPSTEEPSTEEPTVEEANYKVQWYDTKGKMIKEEQTRKANIGDKVSVTEQDKVVKGYTFDKGNTKNKLTDIIKEGEETVLKMYFKKKKTSNQPSKPSEEKPSSPSGESSKSESKSESSSAPVITNNNNNNVDGTKKPYVPYNFNYPRIICPQDHSPKVPRTGEEERSSAWPYVVLVLAAGVLVILNRKNKKQK